MITLADLHRKALRRYEAVLKAYFTGEDLFPMVIPVNKTLDRRGGMDAIFEQQRELLLNAKNKTGRGYTLDLKLNAKTGQSEIRKISVDTLADFLYFLDKEAEYQRFIRNVEQIRISSPMLLPLLERMPQLVIEQADKWPDLLKVITYFLQHPKPQQYVRSLPIAVPTKFIETNRPVLRILLDHLIPDHLNADETDFYKRFHVYVEESLVKIRFLDENLRIYPALSHISVWLSEFRTLCLGGSRVFIIENLTSFLTFPNLPDSIAIWGGGFAVTLLGGTDWLLDKQLYYWGDLDAHGFQILDQCRKHFPQTQSLLMDRATFDAHKHLRGKGEQVSVTELPNLTDDEQALFQLLNQNGWRIEQERLGEEWVGNTLSSMI
ncbi:MULTISPECIES: Wadjet anti-phage system protein JetD domain-containing protein [unclassified Spirosoma]|uniref:Wadjet anti-phage system protein JetD domain-containing protein n=1 Tax=unclassified Spirosoma TaxID=2621999 RepID=UPI00096005CA|nr:MULTISPECIES: Wadjet anti-phage system protein JetD domain-containing protein [unclassified Spirosoma]MBN8823359.1 DUF2399 domain-containing protein [Spirosoma sp.]OJW72504.1 MAG: hypothetical protein BGO59_15370 [Spirosoma sp. 48-14]